MDLQDHLACLVQLVMSGKWDRLALQDLRGLLALLEVLEHLEMWVNRVLMVSPEVLDQRVL